MKIATACSKDTDADVVVWLKQSGDNVHIMGRNIKTMDVTKSWYLATIKENGTIVLQQSVGENLGMQLDEAGKIKLEKY